MDRRPDVDIRLSIYHDLEHHATPRSERTGLVLLPTAKRNPRSERETETQAREPPNKYTAMRRWRCLSQYESFRSSSVTKLLVCATSQHDVCGQFGGPALPQAMVWQGERHCEQGESVAITEVLVHEARQFEHHCAVGKPCDCLGSNAAT